jgi:hypothetical protein
MRSHDTYADEPLAGERSQREAAGGKMPLALVALVCDRMLALPLAEPRRGAPIAGTLLERAAALHVEGVDAFGAVDIANAREVCSRERAVGDLVGGHSRSLTPG